MEKKVIKIKETDNWPNTTRLEMIERSEVYDKPVLYQYGYYDGYQKCYKRLKADNEVLLNALKEIIDLFPEKPKLPISYQVLGVANEALSKTNNLFRKIDIEAIKQAENK